MDRPLIMVVDNDLTLISTITARLISDRYDVVILGDGQEVLRKYIEFEPNLLIIDIDLPCIRGFELYKTIKQLSDMPILLIGHHIDSLISKARLSLGSDNYFIKPVSGERLSLVINSLLSNYQKKEGKFINSTKIQCLIPRGFLVIDNLARRVILNDRDISVTENEYRILWELTNNKGRALMNSELLKRVWGEQYLRESGYLYTYIRRLRIKLESNPYKPKCIINIPKFGYRFDCQ